MDEYELNDYDGGGGFENLSDDHTSFIDLDSLFDGKSAGSVSYIEIS